MKSNNELERVVDSSADVHQRSDEERVRYGRRFDVRVGHGHRLTLDVRLEDHLAGFYLGRLLFEQVEQREELVLCSQKQYKATLN